MDNQHKKIYEAPALTVVKFKMEQGYAASGGLVGAFRLGNSWDDNGLDAWDGFSSGSGSYFGNGWTDNGGSAWE